ncbi:glycine dehydrogenase, partial [Bacteroidota bacterium]
MANEEFVSRHNGPRDHEIGYMLEKIGCSSLDEFISEVIPDSIRLENPLNLPDGISEMEYFERIREIASKNKIFRSFIGMGYYGTVMPAVIQRNILENPSWYTSYTPYQAEISQGRLEALLNYQTVVMELTGMELANASLLDEGTSAAEAMILMYNKRSRNARKNEANILFIDEDTFPQTIDVVKTRAIPLGIEVITGKFEDFQFNEKVFGLLMQYPTASGTLKDYEDITLKAHDNECLVTVAADLLSLALLTPPGEWGADIVVGSTQRFGIPLGFGGPHAGYFAVRDELKRSMPGRIIGVSVDVDGNQALRMALQTREQHIKREKATSNICTAQALLASMAGMYAAYHGPVGLKKIAKRIHCTAGDLGVQLNELGYNQVNVNFFDTLNIKLPPNVKISEIKRLSLEEKINFYYPDDNTVRLSI